MIPFAIGTGARKSEQLTLKVRQCDFFRNLIIFDKTDRVCRDKQRSVRDSVAALQRQTTR
jgi:hypothetical protein